MSFIDYVILAFHWELGTGGQKYFGFVNFIEILPFRVFFGNLENFVSIFRGVRCTLIFLLFLKNWKSEKFKRNANT